MPGFPGTLCGVNPGLAGFEEEDEMAAIDRYGIKEAAGFATEELISFWLSVASLEKARDEGGITSQRQRGC